MNPAQVKYPLLLVDHMCFGGRVTTEKERLLLNVLLSFVSISESG